MYIVQSQNKKRTQDTYLTNGFFFNAFCQAVQQNKGKIDFEERELFDFRYNEAWPMDQDVNTERRGGVLYRAPRGWKRFALNVKGRYPDDDWLRMDGSPDEWAVAYHGTAMSIVPLIVRGGFRVGTGQGAKHSKDVRTGGDVGCGVFCSPNLTTVECYANGSEDGGSESKDKAAATVDGHTLFFALQCRVRPSAIRRPDRHFARNNDEEVMGIDGVFEWIINNPDDIRPYGILVRDKNTCDHRRLGELIGKVGGEHRWNIEHKPLPIGSFDHIPGRHADPQQIQDSYLRAVKALN